MRRTEPENLPARSEGKRLMAEEDRLVERLRKDDDLSSRIEAADRIEQLEADMRRLEQIYNRDQVAQVFANEIETIFDRWALKLNATERY